MDIDFILQEFLYLSGEKDEEKWRWLCIISKNEIYSRIKKNMPERQDEINHATAAWAFLKYSLIKDAENEEGFSAGNIKVACRRKAPIAKIIWEQASKGIEDILISDDFVFLGVDG